MPLKETYLRLLGNNYGARGNVFSEHSDHSKGGDNDRLGYLDSRAKRETQKRKEKEKEKAEKDKLKAKRENKKIKEYYSRNKIAINSLLAGIFSLFIYFLLPAGYKIFSFILPAIIISCIFTKKRFSFEIFTALCLLFLLFPTSIFTLDSTQSFNVKLIQTQNYVNEAMKVVSGVIFIAIPIIALLASLWALYKGNVEQGTSMLTKLFVFVLLGSVSIFIFEQFNVPIISDIKPFMVFSDFLLTIISWIGNVFVGIINGIDIFGAIPDIPEIPTNLRLDSSMSNIQDFNLILIGSFPILLNLIVIIFAILLWITKWEIPKLQFTKEHKFSRPGSFNSVFLVYLVFIWIAYFYYYLWVGEDKFLNYRTAGFYTIYLSIISGACIISAFGGISYSKINIKTIFGIFIGNFAIFCFQNLYTQAQTLDAYLLEAGSVNWDNLIGQIIAVAPAESFLFHIFTTGLYLMFVFLRYNNLNDKKIEQQIQKRQDIINRKKQENELYQTKLLKPKQALSDEHKKTLNKNDVGDLDDYIKRIQDIQRLENTISQLKDQKDQDIDFSIDRISQNEQYGLYFVIILSNFLFATMHCVLLTPNGFAFNFRVFWSSALGLIYFFSGIILSYVSFRYGWITGIVCHIINNTAIYAMIIIGGLI